MDWLFIAIYAIPTKWVSNFLHITAALVAQLLMAICSSGYFQIFQTNEDGKIGMRDSKRNCRKVWKLSRCFRRNVMFCSTGCSIIQRQVFFDLGVSCSETKILLKLCIPYLVLQISTIDALVLQKDAQIERLSHKFMATTTVDYQTLLIPLVISFVQVSNASLDLVSFSWTTCVYQMSIPLF